ncbi:hypothetical protein niasHS_003662 [Heterodera schachtii]|uniref:Nucleoporin protein Ndc1-Nup n=1 Tax=Heterodera schachtii TaxID=97005 RepID=A0ABD2KHD0_HETSC
MSPKFLFVLFLQMAVVFLECLLLSTWIFSVTFETNLNIIKFDCLLAASAIFASNVSLYFLLSLAVPKHLFWFSSGSSFLLWLMSSIVLAFYCAFSTNFQLRFEENSFAIFKMKKDVVSALVRPIIRHSFSTAKVFCFAWVVAFNFALLLRPFHASLPSLFAFWHFADFFLPLFARVLILRLTPFVVTHFLMKPIEFVMPTVFYAATEGLRSTMTLTNALESNDPLTKFFALYMLQRMCSANTSTRKPFFALSQPGGHPRNWHSLRDVAIAHLRNVRNIFQIATHCKILVHSPGVGSASISKSLADASVFDKSEEIDEDNANKSLVNRNGSLLLNSSTGSTGVLNELYEAKHSFFVPPSLNPRSADAFLSERVHCRRRLIVVPLFCDFIVNRCKELLFAPAPIVSSYDTLCTLYAIKALSKVISHSLHEDEFGVVQKDMSKSLSELTRLSIAIDAFVRANGRNSNASIERNTVALDEGLAAALKEIREVFGPHISDLNLHPTELEVLRMVA